MCNQPPKGRPRGRAGVCVVALLAAWTGLTLLVGGNRADDAPALVGVSFAPSPARQPEPQSDASPVREAVVVMDDGTRYTGLLLEQTDERVVLEIGGVELPLRATEVRRVEVLPPVRERYARLRAATPDDNIPGLLTLVRWLVERREYDLAGEELLDIRRQDPSNRDALELERLIAAQRLLEPRQAEEDEDEPEEPSASADVLRTLSSEEINLIRVYELDLDRLPRVIIPREVVERLVEEFRGDPLIPATREGLDDLVRAARRDPERVLDIIFRLKARHLYSQIQVIDNPRSMQMFRDRVHRTWLINGCASCHNTRPDAPRGPTLITRRRNSDATVFSNFLILERYRLEDGTPLINYDDPGESPLLHMGLPRNLARWPHPDVADARGWTPVFLSRSNPSFNNATEWIRSMYRPRPDYPVEYPPPSDQPTAEPRPER
ncbi:MAG: hypothetical protein KDA05_09255 [Phycisphaerales bacterium]|nr:hypothetical protein [Phycisphaerales bacterium]